jgi:predicted O-methyltransferase YrrM
MLYSVPSQLNKIQEKANELKFTMSCDLDTGYLLRALVSSKPSGTFLELGTGVGVSTLWLIEGMDSHSTLISVEMDKNLHKIAKTIITDHRVQLLTMDGGLFIKVNRDKKFDLIFADTWPGKYYLLEETLAMVKPGGFYIIDDLTPVENWPESHLEKAKNLIKIMKEHKDFYIVELNWSTGIIISTRK